MEQPWNIIDPQHLSSINDVVHDCWFDRKEFKFDSVSRILDIPFRLEASNKKQLIKTFWFLKRYQVPIILCTLRILHVESYRVHERKEEGPGTDDCFVVVDYLANERRIIIETLFTEGIEINVKEFEIALIEGEKVISVRERLSIF